jgi:hypothetical protein
MYIRKCGTEQDNGKDVRQKRLKLGRPYTENNPREVLSWNFKGRHRKGRPSSVGSG